MSRTPAKVTQADVARAIRAAQSCGAGKVRIMPDGTNDVVYFVRIGKHIKIGFSSNLRRRLKSFENSAVDVYLMLAVPGDRSLEQRIHRLLVDERITREIFHPESRLLRFIEMIEHRGLEFGLQYLEDSTPARIKAAREAERMARFKAVRQSKADKNTYFATLVAARKERLGW